MIIKVERILVEDLRYYRIQSIGQVLGGIWKKSRFKWVCGKREFEFKSAF